MGPDHHVPCPENLTPNKLMCKNPNYIFVDSVNRDRFAWQDAGHFTVLNTEFRGSEPVQVHPQQHYYMKLKKATFPYDAAYVNLRYLFLRVRINANSISSRRPFSNNQWFQEEMFFVPMDDERYLVPAGVSTPPSWIHLKSSMKIPVFNPYKSNIEIEWLTLAGAPIVFGNPAPVPPPAAIGPDNPLLQTYALFEITSCCDEGACNNESKMRRC
jgi:hypothetical protein